MTEKNESPYAYESLTLTPKGLRWLLSKCEKDDPLRTRIIDALLERGEPLHVDGELEEKRR